MPRNTNPRRPRAPKAAAPVEAIQHKDTRTNIPTEQLKDFLPDEPAKQFRYPRDPSLDPQLVWKGKDELDSEDLTGWLRPIFIQEKIHPRALIEDLRKQSQERSGGGDQLNFFADFNGLNNFEEKVEFYQHQQHWSNRMILGDSLMVMASLAEKEGLRGRVQTIYLDPPYGIKFGSNWQVSTRKRDVRDGRADDLTRQPEQVRAFRDTWQQGIHSYLTYLRDRFTVARDLLTESGSIFVQIGEENVHLVRSVLDEVFGSENFCGAIAFAKTTGQTSDLLAPVFDHLIWFAKSRPAIKYRQLYSDKVAEDLRSTYRRVEAPNGEIRNLKAAESLADVVATGSRLLTFSDLVSQSGSEATQRQFEWRGDTYRPREGGWKTHQIGLGRLALADRLGAAGRTLLYRRYFDDAPVLPINALWLDTALGGYLRDETKIYAVQTARRVIERCLLMTTDPGDLVLDPTCGSGTTAYVAEQWGRRWITIDTSRVALALARTRLMSARYPYYLLADSDAGRATQAELLGEGMVSYSTPASNDVRQGFVYQRVPHIQLRDIANNDEIDGIWERWQARLEPLRASLNKALRESWEEWQIPREAGEGWAAAALTAHRDWWDARRTRQREIDESIARHSESEVLYDQPYEDSKRVRVAGPFTVESLSPHRVLDPEEQERPSAERQAQADPAQPGWEALVIEHLRSAGIQNTKHGERLKFVRLERHANPWLHAVGEWEQDGVARRIAVSIGSEYGTVGSDWVKEAAKEALKGAGFDLLAVCAIAFDGNAAGAASEFQPSPPTPLPATGRGGKEGERSGFAIAESERQYGRLPVVLVRVNPDLAMGDDLLKKTGAGNLFTVFGEPDIAIKRAKDGMLTAAIAGLDIYDPTTGEVRSSKGTDDIACWFIDTEYDGESFFVRHAYFTGADEPYERLQRALRAEVDEEAWASLYRAESRPFPVPASGRIAVKVINHYGDEVLKVYEVS